MKRDTITSVITGLHRSGTTYVGHILNLSKSTITVHEPFNSISGLRYAPPVYIYITAKSPVKLTQPIDNALLFHGNFVKPADISNSHLKNLRYKLIGGKQHAVWNMLKMLDLLNLLPEHIIWKDPFAIFMVGYLTKVRKVKVVVLIKHPCAHYYSVKKQNWFFDIDKLTDQKELIRCFGQDISEEYWKQAKSDNMISIALLWKIMSRYINTFINNDSVMIVRHEDLCTTPYEVFHKICNHLDMCCTSRMRKRIGQTTENRSVESSEGQQHDFMRNSKLLKNIWREKLSLSDQKKILKVVGNDIRPFY